MQLGPHAQSQLRLLRGPHGHRRVVSAVTGFVAQREAARGTPRSRSSSACATSNAAYCSHLLVLQRTAADLAGLLHPLRGGPRRRHDLQAWLHLFSPRPPSPSRLGPGRWARPSCRPIPRSRARETCRSRSAGAGSSSTGRHPGPRGRTAGARRPAIETGAGPTHRSSRPPCLASADGGPQGPPAPARSRVRGIDCRRAGAASDRGQWARSPRRPSECPDGCVVVRREGSRRLQEPKRGCPEPSSHLGCGAVVGRKRFSSGGYAGRCSTPRRWKYAETARSSHWRASCSPSASVARYDAEGRLCSTWSMP